MITLILGPMFAGKSSFLLNEINKLKLIKKEYIAIKPKIDNRYSEDKIVSHNFISENCFSINSLTELEETGLLDKIDIIIIEEAQFFEGLRDFILKYELNKDFIIAGLSGDSDRKPFGEILQVIPLCDNLIKLDSLCLECNDGNKAIFSRCNVNKNSQNLIGSNDLYSCVCRHHYHFPKHKNKSKKKINLLEHSL